MSHQMNLTKFFQIITLLIIATGIVATVQARSANEVQPILIGSKVPDAKLKDQTGNDVSLHDIIANKNTAVIFYRGSWCPYCNTHLQELAAAESELIELGYQIIAISPDSPEMLNTTDEKHTLNYALYSDSDFEAADAFGISFELPKANIARLKSFGIDLEKSSGGKNANRLPVSSVFLITPNKEVSFHHVDPNYKFRIPGKLLLAAAESSLKFHTK